MQAVSYNERYTMLMWCTKFVIAKVCILFRIENVFQYKNIATDHLEFTNNHLILKITSTYNKLATQYGLWNPSYLQTLFRTAQEEISYTEINNPYYTLVITNYTKINIQY